jgi:hypothetical protein
VLESRGDDQIRSRLGQNKPLISGLLHLLGNGSDAARYWSCQCIVSLSHKHTQNQSAIARHPGMMRAILEVLMHGGTLSRGAACSALVESTFRNAENALLVAKTPGMMLGVVSVMQASVGDVRDDAAGVLRNCSNYSQEAAEIIVQTPGVLDGLIEMCKGQHNSDRFTAMGTIQNLTRCESVRPLLCRTRVVADALQPALEAVGTGEEHDVMRAEALMAITNLTAVEELRLLEAQPDIVEVIVQMLRCAVRGQAWKDVAWYDAEECLQPLLHMVMNPANHAVLRSVGLVHVLVDLMCYWVERQSLRLPFTLHEEARCALALISIEDSGYQHQLLQTRASEAFGGVAHGGIDASNDVIANVDTFIGIGHDRLRHALMVWEVAGRRPCVVHHSRTACIHDVAGVHDDVPFKRPEETCCSSLCSCERGCETEMAATVKELDMAALAMVKLAHTEACARTMRRLGLPGVLRAVSSAAFGAAPVPRAFPWAQVWIMERRHLAVFMGQHTRLGCKSLLMHLDTPILWAIIQNASCMCSALDSLADELEAQTERDLAACKLGCSSPMTLPALSPSTVPLHEASALLANEGSEEDGIAACKGALGGSRWPRQRRVHQNLLNI